MSNKGVKALFVAERILGSQFLYLFSEKMFFSFWFVDINWTKQFGLHIHSENATSLLSDYKAITLILNQMLSLHKIGYAYYFIEALDAIWHKINCKLVNVLIFAQLVNDFINGVTKATHPYSCSSVYEKEI